MSAINTFLLQNGLRIAGNPCISPDFCLDWPALSARLVAGQPVTRYPRSRFQIAAGALELVSDDQGDHAWILESSRDGAASLLEGGVAVGAGKTAFPATWRNLLVLKNRLQEHDPASTIFPTAAGSLDHASIGVGARFTTLHWPAVEWAMAHLNLPLTANQNSIPRELVFDVDAMLADRLDTVPFPFIGGNIPEGHQGQSVEGMSHGAVISKLTTGFHARRIPWGFNADHQPIGGKFDAREDRLVEGAVLASYITFDLSPELGVTTPPASADAARAYVEKEVGAELLGRVRARVQEAGLTVDDGALHGLLAQVWPAVRKMKRRDEKYAAARAAAFTTPVGRAYFRELSIDELPGLTTPETLATMLALCEGLGMKIHFVAPAFGFQKNFPFDDNVELERRLGKAWQVCTRFGVSIGFHSGSGKSAENYRLCGRITGGHLEIKTSGRYTYEMGVALSASRDAGDQALWRDWYAFTRELAVGSAFGTHETERDMARQFIAHALQHEKRSADGVFATALACRQALEALPPSPDHMFWFEYNFLYVLARGGQHDKASLGDHSPAGYKQRARFYAISEEGRLRYAQGVGRYLCFLADTTGLAKPEACAKAAARLGAYTRYSDLIADIGRTEG
jgi:hypothetical protein